MYLIYASSQRELSSIKQWLTLTHRDDYLLLYDAEDFINEMLIDSYDVIIFDYHLNVGLIDNLRLIDSAYNSIEVFVSTLEIGRAYSVLTDNIHILPKAVNLMLYLWEHPAFSLDNMESAKEVGEEVFSISDFATIDTERDVLEFHTTVRDLGSYDLAQLELLKLDKASLMVQNTIEEQIDTNEDLQTDVIKEDSIVENEEIIEETVELNLDEFDNRVLKGLLKRHKLMSMIPETIETVEEIADNIIIEASIENEENKVLESIEPDSPIPVESSESSIPVEESESSIPAEIIDTTLMIDDIINVLDTNKDVVEEKQSEQSIPAEQSISSEPSIPAEQSTSSESSGIVYEEFDEAHKDLYDKVIIEEKQITAESSINAEYDTNMIDFIKDSAKKVDSTIHSSTVFDNGQHFNIKSEELIGIQDKEPDIQEKSIEKSDVVDKTKREIKILKGVKNESSTTLEEPRYVGIKTIEKNTPIENPHTNSGVLAKLRRRNVRTYKTSYDYFMDKNYDKRAITEVYDYVSSENRKGNNLLLEEELYTRNIIDDDGYIIFMKEYLHRQALTLSELMERDVVFDEFDENTCRGLRILQIMTGTNEVCVVIGHKSHSLINTLVSKYEKINLFFTLDKYIDYRIGE